MGGRGGREPEGRDEVAERQVCVRLSTRAVFVRAVALVYLIAFVSLWTQIHGLIGEHGIVPVGELLEAAGQMLGGAAHRRYPTLLWISAGDSTLTLVCAAGSVASVLLLVGYVPVAASLACWVLYLSLFVGGQVFLSFQWDILLLETGVLVVLLAPPCASPRGWRHHPPSPAVVWLVRWLLFRLMFASGVVKLMSGDPAWWDLSALSYHYESQPLPPWTAWYMHHLPLWLHRWTCAAMFVIELGVPFLIFCGRRARILAFWVFTCFQLVIIATGNYTFFNYLTIALGIPLLDDRALGLLGKASRRSGVQTAPARPPAPARSPAPTTGRALRAAFVGTAVVLIAVLSTLNFTARFTGYSALPRPLRTLLASTAPFRLTSNYGLFAVMTRGRPEIIVEGSRDGREWREYPFRYKPGDVRRRPAFVAPHQPRLDWQMWFAALSDFRRQRWFGRFLQRLAEGSPEVLGLLAADPFAGAPPRFLRATLYDYTFSHPGARTWWERRRRGPYSPVLRVPERPVVDPDPARHTETMRRGSLEAAARGRSR